MISRSTRLMPALRGAWPKAMPALFVVLWSTGFIGAKFGLPYAEPFTFLFIRCVLTLLLLTPLLALARQHPRPALALWGHAAITGLFVHGAYLGGVFYAIAFGLPAGLASLLVGLQPLVTAALALPLLNERLSRWQWLGLALGLIGITLVLSGKLAPEDGSLFAGFGLEALACILAALLGICAGTLYQKRFGAQVPLLEGSIAQYVAAAVVFGLGAWLLETRHVDWTLPFVATLAWLVLGLSVSAILLLMALIRRGDASKVASLFYLVPPLTALEAWWLFDETLGPLALFGMAITVAGVVLAVRGPRRQAQAPATPADSR